MHFRLVSNSLWVQIQRPRCQPKFFIYVVIGAGLMWFWAISAQSAPQENATKGYETFLEEPVFGGKAYIYEEGREHASTLVLVHGIGANAGRDWKYAVPELAKRFHVVVVDLPGFGKSSQGNELYSPANYIKFLRFVTQRMVKKPFTLVGHSMGSNVSLLYAATYPQDVERLAVADVAGLLHYLSFVKSLTHAQLERLTSLYGMRERLGTALGIVFEKLEKLNSDPKQILENSFARQRVLQGNPRNIAGLAVALEDFSGKLSSINQPTLIIWGRQDVVTPLRTAQVLTELLPHAQLHIIENAAHTPMLEAPAAYNKVLLNFLTAKPSLLAAAHQPKSAPSLQDAAAKHGECRQQRDLSYEGVYERLELRGCTNIIIRNARIGTLEISDSAVTIEDTHIGGEEYGLQATRSTVVMTNGSISASTALILASSRLDLAGVELRGHERIAYSFEGSVILCSLCQFKSTQSDQAAHDVFRLEADNTL